MALAVTTPKDREAFSIRRFSFREFLLPRKRFRQRLECPGSFWVLATAELSMQLDSLTGELLCVRKATLVVSHSGEPMQQAGFVK